MAAVTPESEKAWGEFLNRIEGTCETLRKDDPSEELWFRGHSRCDFSLMPSLLRSFANPTKDEVWQRISDLESDLFWEFAARARDLHQSHQSKMRDWDILFAMQHYGTPTRLLDWTEILGVAVYFAVVDAPEATSKDAPPPCIWVLNPYQMNEVSTECRDLFAPENLGWDPSEGVYYTYGDLLSEGYLDFDNPIAIYPRQANPRLHAQRAWFTIHGDDFVPIDRIESFQECIKKVPLPWEALPSARRFLSHAGIDHYLLFGDLENLSRHLREKNGLPCHRKA